MKFLGKGLGNSTPQLDGYSQGAFTGQPALKGNKLDNAKALESGGSSTALFTL